MDMLLLTIILTNSQITSSGKFYDVKSLSPIKPANMTTFTGTSKVTLTHYTISLMDMVLMRALLLFLI